MSPWDLLDLPHDADAASVRRRYAELLRKTRPEDDPAGFQRLRLAYERALEVARWRERRGTPESPEADRANDGVTTAATDDAAPVGPSGAAPRADEPATPAMDDVDPAAVEAAVDDLFAACAGAAPAAAALDTAWSQCPPLFSLEAQIVAEVSLLRRLATTPGIRTEFAVALIDRFGWHQPWASRWLIERTPLASEWLLAIRPFLWRHEFETHLRSGPFMAATPFGIAIETRDLDALSRPLASRWRAFLAEFGGGGRSQRMLQLAAHYTDTHGPAAASACLDAAQLSFWRELADRPQGSHYRLLQSFLYAVLALLFAALLRLPPPDWMLSSNRATLASRLSAGSIVVVLLAAAYLLYEIGSWAHARLAARRSG